MVDPRFRGSAKPEPTSSRREQQKAVEEGIDVVRDAIKDLLKKPKGERERHLRVLAEQLTSMAGRMDRVDNSGDGARRVKATKNIIEILEKVSAKI